MSTFFALSTFAGAAGVAAVVEAVRRHLVGGRLDRDLHAAGTIGVLR